MKAKKGIIAGLLAIVVGSVLWSRRNAAAETDGSESNPYDYSGGWQGAGYYINAPGETVAVFISTEEEYTNWGYVAPAGGTEANPYDYNSGWQGAGYYINAPGETVAVFMATNVRFFNFTEIVENHLPEYIIGWAENNCSGPYNYGAPAGYVRTSCAYGGVGIHGGCSGCAMSLVRCDKEPVEETAVSRKVG
jgi:hypothetical protein